MGKRSQTSRAGVDTTGIAYFLQTGDRVGPIPEPVERADVVYAVEAGGLVKIGTTTDLGSRLRAIQANCPMPIVLLGMAKGNRHLESALHRQFAAVRRHGEWFDLNDEDRVVLLGRLDGDPLLIKVAAVNGWQKPTWKQRQKRQRKGKRH